MSSDYEYERLTERLEIDFAGIGDVQDAVKEIKRLETEVECLSELLEAAVMDYNDQLSETKRLRKEVANKGRQIDLHDLEKPALKLMAAAGQSLQDEIERLREALVTVDAMAKSTPYRPDSTIVNILKVTGATLKESGDE